MLVTSRPRHLQLNSIETEVIWSGSKCYLSNIATYDLSPSVGVDSIQPVTVVHDLGVWLDKELPLKQHINKVVSVRFYQLIMTIIITVNTDSFYLAVTRRNRYQGAKVATATSTNERI
jgi:hypothetical protein